VTEGALPSTIPALICDGHTAVLICFFVVFYRTGAQGFLTLLSLSCAAPSQRFAGNPARCIANCAAQTIGPNGDAGVDGMISIIAHELTEAASDPNGSAW
jgi:hypothetical protein